MHNFTDLTRRVWPIHPNQHYGWQPIGLTVQLANRNESPILSTPPWCGSCPIMVQVLACCPGPHIDHSPDFVMREISYQRESEERDNE